MQNITFWDHRDVLVIITRVIFKVNSASLEVVLEVMFTPPSASIVVPGVIEGMADAGSSRYPWLRSNKLLEAAASLGPRNGAFDMFWTGAPAGV